MKEFYLNTENLKSSVHLLSAGDKVYLSGCVYTARDAAHAKIDYLMNNNMPLPFPILNSVIYYAGPTPTPEGMAIGSCGPTTSSRMDVFTPSLLDAGLTAMIGKGDRCKSVYDSIVKNGAVYFCAIGGAGALAAKCITKCEVIAFEELGCESVKKLEFNNFPLYVAIDCNGNSLMHSTL